MKELVDTRNDDPGIGSSQIVEQRARCRVVDVGDCGRINHDAMHRIRRLGDERPDLIREAIGIGEE